MSYIDLNLESQDIKLKVIDNGDGTYSLATVTISGTSSSVEVSNLSELPNTSSASNAFIITPNDSSDLAHTTRGVYVTESGNMKATFTDSGTVVISGLLAGIVYPFNIKKVFETETTVVGIIGLY